MPPRLRDRLQNRAGSFGNCLGVFIVYFFKRINIQRDFKMTIDPFQIIMVPLSRPPRENLS